MTHIRTILPTETPCRLCGGQVWTNGAVTMCGDCIQMLFPPSPAVPSTTDAAGALAGGASRLAGLSHNQSARVQVRADAAPGLAQVTPAEGGQTAARHIYFAETDRGDSGGRAKSPQHGQTAPATKGNIRATIALAIFVAVVFYAPALIHWIGS